MSAFSKRVENITQDEIAPMVVDTVFRSNTFASIVLGKSKQFKGYQMRHPVKVSRANQGKSFSGFDTFNRTAVDNTETLVVDPRHYEHPVVLPLDEVTYNGGDNQVIDLIKYQMQSAAQDMADEIGTLFYSDGTGNGGKDFSGLEKIVDDGSNINSYFGLSRTTYSTLQSTVDSSSNTLTLAKLDSLYDSITDGAQLPTDIFSQPEDFSLYAQLLQAQERIYKEPKLYNEGLKGSAGYSTLDYRGIPWRKDRKCTADTIYMVNMDDINFYANKFARTEAVDMSNTVIDDNDYSKFPFTGFSWSGWKESYNQAAIAGDFYLSGELVSTNPKRHGKLTGITTV